MSLYGALDGVDAHIDRAVTEAAEIPSPLADTDYGFGKDTARDREENLWSSARTAREAHNPPRADREVRRATAGACCSLPSPNYCLSVEPIADS
jgi:hypothetical protein